MRFLTTIAICLFWSILAQAQNFEPAPNTPFQLKMENTLKNLGTIERVYLSDTKAKTFETNAGQEYWIGYVYPLASKATRRQMIIQLGAQGEKVGIRYPKYTKGLTDGVNQVFGLNFTAPTDAGKTVMFKIDASPECDVYIYKINRSASR